MNPDEAARRVKRFEATIDARTLWPDVTEEQFGAAMREIVRVTPPLVAREGPAGEISAPVPGGISAFGVAAFASGLGPLLGYWHERGRLRVPADLAPVLASHLDHGRRRASRLRSELERIVGMFEVHEIPVTVLKGMHTGWMYFPEPGTRPSADIDLLIPPDRVVDARRLLQVAGFQPTGAMSERTTWAPPDHAPPVSVDLTHVDNPWTLDLHVTLDRRFADAGTVTRFGLRPEDVREWNTGGMQVHVLSQPLLSCFLAVHATHHFPYVSALRLVELALVFERDGGSGFPWKSLGDRFAATGATTFGYPGLKLTEDLCPGTVDPTLLAQLREATPPNVRALTDRLTPATALQLYRRSFEGRFLWAGSGWRRLGAFARWLWPRDSDGARLPIAEATRITGRRVRRLATGLLSWRHR